MDDYLENAYERMMIGKTQSIDVPIDLTCMSLYEIAQATASSSETIRYDSED